MTPRVIQYKFYGKGYVADSYTVKQQRAEDQLEHIEECSKKGKLKYLFTYVYIY